MFLLHFSSRSFVKFVQFLVPSKTVTCCTREQTSIGNKFVCFTDGKEELTSMEEHTMLIIRQGVQVGRGLSRYLPGMYMLDLLCFVSIPINDQLERGFLYSNDEKEGYRTRYSSFVVIKQVIEILL